jgi:hypothetical protein
MSETLHGYPVVRVDGPPPAVIAPEAPCHHCRHFHGWARIPTVDTKSPVGHCGALRWTPELVVRGHPCDRFEAGEHREYT